MSCSYTGGDKLIMKKIKYLAIRLASKVTSIVIEFAYNPNQAEIIQLLLDMYEVISFVILL